MGPPRAAGRWDTRACVSVFRALWTALFSLWLLALVMWPARLSIAIDAESGTVYYGPPDADVAHIFFDTRFPEGETFRDSFVPVGNVRIEQGLDLVLGAELTGRLNRLCGAFWPSDRDD